jgi:excisionase family DNA binding protein
MPTDTAPSLLTTKDVAALLGVSKETVRDWAAAGKLPVVRFSTQTLRYRQADVEALIEANRAA